MVEGPIGYYYRLAKERLPGRKSPLATTYWHADPLCSFIQRGAYPLGPVPVVIDPHDPRVVTCSCFDDAGIVGINVRKNGVEQSSRGGKRR